MRKRAPKLPSKTVRAHDGFSVQVCETTWGPTIFLIKTASKVMKVQGWRGRQYVAAWLARAELRKLRETINQILGEP